MATDTHIHNSAISGPMKFIFGTWDSLGQYEIVYYFVAL